MAAPKSFRPLTNHVGVSRLLKSGWHLRGRQGLIGHSGGCTRSLKHECGGPADGPAALQKLRLTKNGSGEARQRPVAAEVGVAELLDFTSESMCQ